MHARDRRHARNPAPGADDHLAVELLPKDAVRAAHVVLALRRDRRRLDAEAGLGDRARARPDDVVLRPAPVLERQVVVLELDLDAGDAAVEEPQRLPQELLPGLVALQDDNPRDLGHRPTVPP